MKQREEPGTGESLPADSLVGEGADKQSSTPTGLFWPLLAAALLMLTFVTIPPAPAEIDMNADPSLGAVLKYAHQHHWQFGRDVVFTYGPLGYLVFFYFSPQGVWLRMAVDMGLGLLVASGVCLLAWRMQRWWRLALLLVFVFGATNLEPRLDYVLDAGLFCWGLLCFVECGPRLVVCAGTFTALAVFSALGKISFLFTGGLAVVLLAPALALRGYRAPAFGILAGFALALIVGWLMAGQKLWHLGEFSLNALAVVRGYNQALAWEGLPAVRRSGFVVATLAFSLIALRSLTAFDVDREIDQAQKNSDLPFSEGGVHDAAATDSSVLNQNHRASPTAAQRLMLRGLLFAWLFLILYTDWKHGYVREDFFHPAFFLAFAPVLVLGLEALPGRGVIARWSARGLTLACALIALAALQRTFLPAFSISIRQPFRAFACNLQCLLRPTRYFERMNQVIEEQRRQAQLPGIRRIVGQSTVDFFGYNQLYVLYNDLNYRPAPVFQSYAACNEPLAHLNEDFYVSPDAPAYVIFTLAAVDRKFPPLENMRVLRDLLFNYELAGTENRFLLLRRRASELPKLALLREGVVRGGQPIDLSAYSETNLWLEIHLEATVFGWLREFLYRAPTVRFAVWREPGKGLLDRHRAPPASLAAGFLVSPLLLRTRDVQSIYEGKPVTHPGACSVELVPGEEHWWERDIRFRIYAIENKLGG